MSLQRQSHANHAPGHPDGHERSSPARRRHQEAERAPTGRAFTKRLHALRCAEADDEIRQYRRQH